MKGSISEFELGVTRARRGELRISVNCACSVFLGWRTLIIPSPYNKLKDTKKTGGASYGACLKPFRDLERVALNLFHILRP